MITWLSGRAFGVATAAAVLIGIGAISEPVQAQTGSIRGRISMSKTGAALEAATVTVVGTRLGTRTREDGLYTINGVPAGPQQVRVVRVGYGAVIRTVTVDAGQTVTLDIGLEETPIALEELVVTGTAVEARKKEIGNSLSAISAEELKLVPVANTQDIIAARVAGVTVLANSGQPGAGGTIRLRGNNSISQSNNPIVYVDGIRIYSEDGPAALQARQGSLSFNDINAEDIERVEIVKGAAATTLYGTEASGGVIQIFTKKGSSGTPTWDATIGAGANQAAAFGPKDDPTGMFLRQCSGPGLVDTDGKPFVDPTCPASGSWLRSGLAQRYALSVRGGSELLTYSLSGTFSSDNGYIETGGAKTGGFRGNFTFTPHSKLTLQLSTGYTKKNIRWVPDGNNASGFLLNVNRGPFNNYKGGKGECEGITITCVTNGYILDELNYNRSDHFVTGLVINWNNTPKLTNRFAVGYDFVTSDDQSARPFGNLRSPLGFIWKVDWMHTKLSVDYSGSFRTNLTDGIESTSSWGGQLFQDRDNYTRVDGDDFSGPGEPVLGSAARATVQETSRLKVINAGFFGQQMFGIKDRLFITGGVRVDGNSAFGDNFGLQLYPKLSVAYNISEESWFPTDLFQTFKVRAAAGYSGKAPGAFDAQRTWSPVAGDEGKPGFTPAQIGNPELGPERTREIEGGFDLVTLNGRVGLEVTGFLTRTFDALVPVTYPTTQGFLSTQLENVGTIGNKGLEITLNASLIESRNFDWQMRGNLSLNKSEAIDIDGQVIEFGSSRSQVREGYSVPSYFGPKITNPDAFADPIIEQDQYLGRNYPNRITSLQTSMTLFRRFTVDALGEWQAGAVLANWVGYQNGRRGIWPPCYAVQAKLKAAKAGNQAALNDVTALERVKCGSDAIDRTVIDFNWWVTSSDFFKLRTLSVSYELPRNLLRTFGVRSGTITAAGRNLIRITDYDGTDPESNDIRDAGGVNLGRRDYYNMPPLRSFLFSMRLAF